MVYGEAISSDRSTVESSTPKEFIRGLPRQEYFRYVEQSRVL